MNEILNISVINQIGDLLNTREAAVKLVDIIEKSKLDKIELDFTDVEFMSRSFADQYIKEINKRNEKSEVVVNFINANEEIINMINIVSKTQHKINREFTSFPVFKFTNSQLLSDYLFGI